MKEQDLREVVRNFQEMGIFPVWGHVDREDDQSPWNWDFANMLSPGATEATLNGFILVTLKRPEEEVERGCSYLLFSSFI